MALNMKERLLIERAKRHFEHNGVCILPNDISEEVRQKLQSIRGSTLVVTENGVTIINIHQSAINVPDEIVTLCNICVNLSRPEIETMINLAEKAGTIDEEWKSILLENR